MARWTAIGIVLLTLLVADVAGAATGYPRVPRRGSFATFLSRLGRAARQHNMHVIRRLAAHGFTNGEENDRDFSLDQVRASSSAQRALGDLADRGACYLTGRHLVQCELPDPGPDLDHTRSASTSIAIFERTRHGWKMNALFVP